MKFLSLRAFLFLIAALIASEAHATTYYVDNCVVVGSDSNNGTSTGTPWLTVAKVNASTFAAGDSVLFERSCIWYGTALTFPSSGSSGNPITIGAYGSGANPILKASSLLNTSGYTLAPAVPTNIFALSDSGTFSNDSGTRNWRQQIPVGEITNSASQIRITVKAAPANALNITDAGIGPVSTASGTPLSNGAFSLAPTVSTPIFSLHDSGTSSTDSATRNWREQVDHTFISASATTVSVTVKASATAALNITGSAIGPATTAPNTSAMTRITWNGGSNGATVAAGTTLTSDAISYSLSNATDQIVSIYTTARNVEYWSNNGTTLWTGFTASDQSQNTSVSSYSTGGNSVIGTISSVTIPVSTYYQALSNTPTSVTENGAALTAQTSSVLVEANAGSWFYDGTYIYIHATDSSNVATNNKAYAYSGGGAPNTTAITRITWNGGQTTVTVPAGSSLTSDWITYALDNTKDQIVTFYTTARNVEYFSKNTETLWSGFTAADQSQQTQPAGTYTTGGNSVVGAIQANATTKYTYSAAIGTAPVALWENGVLMSSQVGTLGTDATPGSWSYDGTNLYLHASDNSNVATNGHKYSYVTAASPSFTMWDNAQNWLVINGLDQAETYNTSSATLGGLYLTGTHSIVENLAAHDTFRHGFCFYLTAASNTATNVTFYNSYGTSPVCIYGASTTGNLLQNCTVTNDTYLRSAYTVTGGVWSVIVAHGGAHGNTVDSCVLQSTAGPYRSNTNVAHGYGMLVGDSGTTVTLSHSLLYGNFEWGVYLGQNGNVGEGPLGQITLWDNLIDCTQCSLSATGGNAFYAYGAAAGNILYDNTIYAPAMTNPAVSLLSTTTGTLMKNNIVYAGGYVTVDASSETSSAIDYNDYFGASGGTPFSWGGTAYSFANWKSNSSQDAHAIVTDPKLINAPARIYTLATGSGAITGGVSLGSTYQSSLLPASSWPSGVMLQNRGGTWEIGAYLYVGGSNPPGGVADQVAPIAVGP